MHKRIAGIVVVLFFAAACGTSDVERTQSAGEPIEATLATDCSVLAPPEVSAACAACVTQSSCQANGCYNGYWCNTSTSKCRTPPTDCGTGGGQDGTPTRRACTGNFGNQLSSRFGRLDGTIVAVVPPGGSRTCNGDSGHVHLQIAMKGQTYDVAINTDAYQDATDIGLPGGGWSEGWHTGASLDYTQLGVHSSSFTKGSASSAAHRIESFVANANHVSVFATGYNASGVHLVHRSSSGHTDGAVIIGATTATPSALLFRFANQSF